jgi:hypothetical protein
VPNTPKQQRRVEQVEVLLRVAAPFLDVVLATGERVARLASRGDDGHYAIPPAGERLELEAVRGARQPEA